MKIIPESLFPDKSAAGLGEFLRYCQGLALVDGKPKLASITLEVKHLDPLAVLQSIFEESESHFYLECPARQKAIAGAEAVLHCITSGPGRFRKLRDFSREVLDHTIAVGDMSTPHAGPHFFTGFSFFDHVPENSPFQPATLFVPRWQVSFQNGKYAAVANSVVEPDADIDRLVAKLWAAHQKFSVFDYDSVPEVGRTTDRQDVLFHEVGGEGTFEEAVSEALIRIRSGKYRKIVLARAVDLAANEPFDPLESLNRMRNRYPSCYSFSFSGGSGCSFIGATPERLLEISGKTLKTDAIAGSAPRGKTAREDAQLASKFLNSEKDHREHQHVIDSIRKRLLAIGIDPEISVRPGLMALSNIQHLHSPVSASMPPHCHLLDVCEVLHPTPAVGGTPREVALPDIQELESFNRGLYAGSLGWFDGQGDGEMVVSIRSALINGLHARLYAGAGIVEGSDPAKEKQETDLKFNAVLDTLG